MGVVLVVIFGYLIASLPFLIFSSSSFIGKCLRISSGMILFYASMALADQLEHGSGKRPFGIITVLFLVTLAMVFVSQVVVRRGVPLAETAFGLGVFFTSKGVLGDLYAGLASCISVLLLYALLTRCNPVIPVGGG